MSSGNKILALILLALAFGAVRATAENTNGAIVVRSVEFRVDGRTLVSALRRVSGIAGGERFESAAALEAWVEEKKQLLINQRTLAAVEIEVKLDLPPATGPQSADLLVRVRDTWNIIALPYFKYDSNDGFELTAKARDYNFLGTMEALRFDFGYEIENAPFLARDFAKGSYVIEIDSNTPFRAFGFDWKLDFDHTLSYTFEEPLEYENRTGVSLALPLAGTTLSFGAYHGVAVNEKNGDDFVAEYGERYADVWYFSNSFEAEWDIPLGVKVDGFGGLSYIPRSGVEIKYHPGADIGEERRGPVWEIGQELFFGRIDWIGNYRKGLEARIDNANEYNLYTREWDKALSIEAIGHVPLLSFLGASARASAVYRFDKIDDSAGSALRGILDDAVDAKYGVFFSAELPIRVIRFLPSKWFGIGWMRVFDFEQHWSPFADFGMVDSGDEEGARFAIEDAYLSGGLEIITFPLFMRSLYIRISFGVDLRDAYEQRTIPEGDGREIFIGIGHHY